MLKSGKTPLLRARKLEKLFDVGEIYLKLEGLNPTGHKLDRIAEILIKDTIAHRFKKILADGSLNFINALTYFAELEEIEVIIPIFRNERWKNKKIKGLLLDCKTMEVSDKYEAYVELAEKNDCYLAAEGYSNTHISQMILEELTYEITQKIGYEIDTIFTQFCYGYTVTSIYNSYLKGWLKGSVSKFPQLLCGTWHDFDKLYEYYSKPKNKLHKGTDAPDRDITVSSSVFQDDKLLIDSYNAVTETNGEIIKVSENRLKESTRLLRKHEQINVSQQDSYAFAAFYEQVISGKLKKGKHVIILNEGKSSVKIEDMKESVEFSKEELVEFTKDWLAKYSDSTQETADAISNATEKGFILMASRNNEYEGICIIVNTGFKDFIPSYHLAYIGTDKESGGRGVGTELIKRAIDLTDGNLSLHVDLDNKGAKKLYEKMGFKHCYNRMLYKGD
ncbi:MULTISPECIES: pyridoxal-phosphate dependent enzyme [unclassified Fusibacter]|uniref:pyridoxal-phosphate dependent enzyme n=1 Tax=unclassified Fusibacter TaxID=2624464 RepID=UPI0013E963B9|nr:MULTISPECIES: pyridoxal-phosphate dependent enzyme [unclassified Fusibacter]MCK8058199.1 pyridoxal-phosphate dependent enzyme [Fusibacter sp. A2]NPE20782.1 pyridoxal-phosphate dependent enzyme [Fusibacter sp. A1]